MRSRSLASQHDAAVSRRLELLTTELAEVRRDDSWRPDGQTRIRAVPDPIELDDEPAPTPVPLPGRHASRRASASWADLVPEGLRGRVALGAGQVGVVAVLVAVGLALTCWWLLRSGGHQQLAPTALSTPADALATPGGPTAAAVAGASATGSGAAHGKVVVDVTGKVRRPGIAVLREGARVVDALRAAGGARRGVDLGSLNLARVLSDGEQIVVGGSAPVTATSPATAGSVPATGVVDINTADETTLESLPDVGPVTAAAILAWRTQHGSFTSVDQLLDVDGIGDATLAKLTPFVTI
jgi:competence protein ComEA